MTIAVAGAGAVGGRVAQRLTQLSGSRVVVSDPRVAARAALRRRLGRSVTVTDRLGDFDGISTLVLASPAGTHVDVARSALHQECSVVSVSDDVNDVLGLLELDSVARDRNRVVAVGAGFGPGLSCLLARIAARRFDEVAEIHVAKLGTGGPSCARQHHRALATAGHDWRDGEFVRRPGGSGRELLWFPSPVDGHDCYRAALPDAFLLQPWFPSADRITARVAATRRDRLTMGMPMLRRPHPEGVVGAVRVEVRGRVGSTWTSEVLGSAERPAEAAAAVCSIVAAAVDRRAFEPGASGLGGALDPHALVRKLLESGLRVHRFEGAGDTP